MWILDRDGAAGRAQAARELGFASEAVSNIGWRRKARPCSPAAATPQLAGGGPRYAGPRAHHHAAVAGDVRGQPCAPSHRGRSRRRHRRRTGGGHAVLLFDREGRFKARTAPGTYQLHQRPVVVARRLVDHRHQPLRAAPAGCLDAGGEADRAAWGRPPAGYPYLGEAIASQGRPLPATGQAPARDPLARGHLMEPGHVVDVFADGSQAVFNQHPIAQLRDIAWFDGRLLVVDGESFSVQRFAPTVCGRALRRRAGARAAAADARGPALLAHARLALRLARRRRPADRWRHRGLCAPPEAGRAGRGGAAARAARLPGGRTAARAGAPAHAHLRPAAAVRLVVLALALFVALPAAAPGG